MRVGVLELLTYPAKGAWEHFDDLAIKKQYASVSAQAVAAWCRQLGHETHYATYYGWGDPIKQLPGDLDLVFVAAATSVAPLAYAVGKVYRRNGARIVLGGPHTKAFPEDCLRYFDLVVLECDKELVADILADRFEPGSLVSSHQSYSDVPSIEERLPDIRRSAFLSGRPHRGSIIPMMTSIGCPYTCDFCVDWDTPYRALALEPIVEDLEFASRELPGIPIGIVDPNFGIRFDEILGAFEAIPPDRRSPYVVESSLTVLKPDRLERLRATRCAGISPGIESWRSYSNKAAVGSDVNRSKADRVIEQFKTLREYIPYLGANFILGLDVDDGDEPFELTKEFVRETPFVWPSINSPIPFGGTPMFDEFHRAGRTLPSLPLNFYTMPHMPMVFAHYDPAVFLEKMIGLYEVVASWNMLKKRMKAIPYLVGKGFHFFHTGMAKARLQTYRRMLRRMTDDAQFAAFHRGETESLPDHYVTGYKRLLGPYADLMSLDESRPILDQRDQTVSFSGSPVKVRPATDSLTPLAASSG